MNGQYYAIEVPEEEARREELSACLIVAFARYLRAVRPGSYVVVPDSLARYLDPGEFDVDNATPEPDQAPLQA